MEFSAVTRVLSLGIFSVAVIVLVARSSCLNTLRMGMFTRRKRWDRTPGRRDNWRIRVPFW